MVSDKTIHKAFKTCTTLYIQNPLDKFFIFTIYQNYTLALKELLSLIIVFSLIYSFFLFPLWNVCQVKSDWNYYDPIVIYKQWWRHLQ